jgi:6-phosphogluconolactonase
MTSAKINRRGFLKIGAAGTLATVTPAMLIPGNRGSEVSPNMLLFIGTYTGETGSKGIYNCRFDLKSGKITKLHATETDNPSWLAATHDNKFLYSVSEIEEFEGKATGSISAFRIDKDSGSLTLLNTKASQGKTPCHLDIDDNNRFVLAANYNGANVAVLPIMPDGSLGDSHDSMQHIGSSIDPDRQTEPHPHSINLSPDNRFAFVPDLGIDKIISYTFDAEKGNVLPGNPAWTKTAAGAGPRHFTFHPGGEYAYVINELNSTITAYRYDAENGILSELESVSTLPAGFNSPSFCADIHLTPDGRYLYGSNRGHDSIAIFRVDANTGRLQPAGHEKRGINWPRNFIIDPTGKYLLAANRKGNSVLCFTIDRDSGALSPTGHKTEIPAPVCLKLIPA